MEDTETAGAGKEQNTAHSSVTTSKHALLGGGYDLQHQQTSTGEENGKIKVIDGLGSPIV